MPHYWRDWINSNNRKVFLDLAVTFTVNENTTGSLVYIENKIERYRSQPEVSSLIHYLSITINSIAEVLTDNRKH